MILGTEHPEYLEEQRTADLAALAHCLSTLPSGDVLAWYAGAAATEHEWESGSAVTA